MYTIDTCFQVDLKSAVINSFAPGLSLNHFKVGMPSGNITAIQQRVRCHLSNVP
jgi:hypothetical protein